MAEGDAPGPINRQRLTPRSFLGYNTGPDKERTPEPVVETQAAYVPQQLVGPVPSQPPRAPAMALDFQAVLAQLFPFLEGMQQDLTRVAPSQ